MGISEMLGWVKSISDTFGLTIFFQAVILLGLVGVFVNQFFNRH